MNPLERILMGNEAIGRGLVENGCAVAASYPGTPASEILASVVDFAGETGAAIHTEWSVNEKVAYEVALAASYTGKRSAVAMKQVGLNVAADPVTRSAYLGTIGGLVLIVADDPGPHSSQTEQDSRLFALFAKVPVFDPSSPREAKDMVGEAFALSEKYELPVMLRPTTRVCHARQNIALGEPARLDRKSRFERNVPRWVATPAFLTEHHRRLNEKLDRIAEEEDFHPRPVSGKSASGGRAVVASGVVFAHAREILEDLGLLEKADLYQVRLPYPLNRKFVAGLRARYREVLVLEETDRVIEMQIGSDIVRGRGTGHVPRQGELTPEIIERTLREYLDLPGEAPSPGKGKGRRPSLCPGCGHRAAFFAIRDTFPGGIFPSDIGCYTLGMNLGAVDTCHCMGACISQGAGFYHAFAQDGPGFPTIVVTIGDSTFFHAGLPALINAVTQGARFIVVILDNGTTAMTGHQPTPALGLRADGSKGPAVDIAGLVRAAGVRSIGECDPYDVEKMTACLKEADRHMRAADGGVAVLIARHPCIVGREARRAQRVFKMTVTEDCIGCRSCIEDFECGALVHESETDRVRIDENLCIGCGVCVHACPVGAIEAEGEKA